MNVRFLAASDADDLRARFGSALSEHDAEALSALAEARILVVDGLPDGIADALRAGGAIVVTIGTASVLATTRTLLAEIAAQTPAARAVLDALSEALRRAAAPAPRLRMRERSLDLRDEARVMGIVNVTPDSFYERVAGVDAAVAKAAAMAADGAALVDVGGQSYAHWNARIAADDERARVVPAIAAIARAGIDIALVAEPAPLRLLDCMAAGRAIVAPDRPEVRELLEHERTALLFDPAEAGALARAAARLIADAPLRARLGEAARVELELRDLSWRGLARRLVQGVFA